MTERVDCRRLRSTSTDGKNAADDSLAASFFTAVVATMAKRTKHTRFEFFYGGPGTRLIYFFILFLIILTTSIDKT